MVDDIVELTIAGAKVELKDIIKVQFTDHIGSKSDKIVIETVPAYPRPAPEAPCELTFKTLKDGSLIAQHEAGLFHVETTTRTNNRKLTISATGVKFNQPKKVKLSHHYQKTMLSGVVGIVAGRLGHSMKFDTPDVFLKSLYQTNESDVNFLERIAKDYNVLFSIKNDILYFVNKDDGSLPKATVDVTKCEDGSLSLKHTTKTHYKSCEASWYVLDERERKKVTVGGGTPVFKMKGHYKTEEEAKTKAKAKLYDINKGTVKGSFSNRGLPLYAGSKVTLTGTYMGEDDGVYSAQTCTHTWTQANGWKTQLEVEN